jgi:hypothetical protein
MPNPCGAPSRHGPSEAIGPLHVTRPLRLCHQFHHPQRMFLSAYADPWRLPPHPNLLSFGPLPGCRAPS